jgi:hypothetical protein
MASVIQGKQMIAVRPILAVSYMFVVGCAGHPSSPPPAAVGTTYVNASGAPIEQVSANTPAGDLDVKRVMAAKKAGFTVINTDGEVLFCWTKTHIGSRVRRDSDTSCLTAKQWDEIASQTEHEFQQWLRSNPGPMGDHPPPTYSAH